MALRTDSGGAGQRRGGLGDEKHYRALVDCHTVITADRLRGRRAGDGAFAHETAARSPGKVPVIDRGPGYQALAKRDMKKSKRPAKR